MKRKGFFVSRTLFFIVLGTAALLVFMTAFLVRERFAMEEKARQLIIQNDSVMSVNLILSDSLRTRVLGAEAKKQAHSKLNWGK